MANLNTPDLIDCGACSLLLVNSGNTWIIEELFQYEDVKRFYVLRSDHATDIKAFCKYLIDGYLRGTSLNFIISNQENEEVGFISSELTINQATNMPMWSVGYAVHPLHRQQGYASLALQGLTNFLLENYSIQHVMLDISHDNIASISVAKKCGFTIPNDRAGYLDMEHPEVGLRFRWFKQIAGERTTHFNQAAHYYRQQQYAESIEAFKRALREPYIEGSPFTDAQIYSNMGMALSSLQRYSEAYQALRKAQALGLNNSSIEKEIRWLRNNTEIL